ncbi:acyltransferase family protein [Herbiconiux solani]|uniref:acyltransferase family protein n=1 Tax=Herbiconiux solani TaxID=661329 RepID=UPI0009FEBC50|nr:acyltransferase [Herbiconiux solani]
MSKDAPSSPAAVPASSPLPATGRGGPGFFGLLDQLRGIAALLVVWAHLVGFFLEAAGRSWLPFRLVDRFIEKPLAIVESFGWFGVALFFFISGFVITHAATRETGREFITKRILRIYPPLVFAVLLALAIAFVTGSPAKSGDGGALTGWDLLTNFSLANYVAEPRTIILVVAWTLAVEMSFYLLMWGLKTLLPRAPFLLSPAILVIVLIVFAVSGLARPLFFLIITVGMVPLLVLGQLTYLVVTKRLKLWIASLYGIAAWVVWIICMELIYPSNLLPDYSYPTNALFAFLIFLIAVLAEGRVKPFKPLSVVARRSYSLYLVHAPLGLGILGVLNARTSLPYTIELAITLVAVAIATEVCYRFVERPSQALGRRLFPKVKKAVPASV